MTPVAMGLFVKKWQSKVSLAYFVVEVKDKNTIRKNLF